MLDQLDIIAPFLRVRPELQDFCRFGGSWSVAQPRAGKGWSSFHIVTRGSCFVERSSDPPIRLETGDVLLLPHGDDHVVYSSAEPRGELLKLSTTYRDHIRINRTESEDIDTEIICGRLHLESASEDFLLNTLPRLILLKLGGERDCAVLVDMLRTELERARLGSTSVAIDLASALFIKILRRHLEEEPPVKGMLALLVARETRRSVAAMLDEPARDWTLDDLAGTFSCVTCDAGPCVQAPGRYCATVLPH